MTQGNDGFTDPLFDPPRDPPLTPLADSSLDPSRDRWDALRVEDAVRRSGPGEAVFTHGSAGWTDDRSRVSTGQDGGPRSGDESREAAREKARETASEASVPPPPPRELPVIEVSRPEPSRAAAGPARPRARKRPRPRTPSRQRVARGVMGTGVPMVVVAFVGLLGFAGVAGLAAADDDQDWVVGEAPAMPEDVSAPMVEVDVDQRPVRLTVPGTSVEIRTAPGSDVSVEDANCFVEAPENSADRRDATVSCGDVDTSQPIVVTVPTGVSLTVLGGKQLTVVGDLKSLGVNGSTADVVVDDLSAESVRVGTSADVTGRIKGATTVDVLSRSGRVDLQFDTTVRRTRIAAPRGEVALEVPPRAVYDLDLRAGKGSVSSSLKDTAGARDRLTVTTGGQPITVTTTP